ncbi:MAG: WD40/YVTN/BNR-like repeat-containing protein [Haloarculaceae archaeon]
MPTLYAALDDRVLVVEGATEGAEREWASREALVGHRFECVGASPAAPDRVFAGTAGSGLQRSADGGRTWEAVGDFGGRVTAVTVSPHDPETVWAGTEPSAVFRSVDGGGTWAEYEGLTDLPSADRWSFPPRPHTHHVRWVAVNPHDPTHVYVAIEAGAFVRTVDGGRTWETHPEGGRRDNHTLATHHDAPCRVYAAAGDGYAESTDCGATWAYPQAGLDHRYVWGLAVDPADPDTVVVSAARGARRAHWPASARARVYRREGEGPWRVAMDGLPDPEGTVRAVLAAGGPGEFYALTNRGLFRSADAARSWRALDVHWPADYESQVGRGLAVVGN